LAAACLATTAEAGAPAASIMTAIGHGAAAATIASATTVTEAMAAPAVAIAPASPWAHAQEDSVVEVSRPVKTHWRAGVGLIVVIAVRANRWYADVDDDLRASRWRHGQARKQCCSSE
jgi:hypothetical protein